jgi:5S rRNA maturation endonuclease (ribonuclease M5)
MKATELDKKDFKQKKLTQKKISFLCDESLNQIHSLLEYFDISYVEYPNRLAFPCPVHDGDNPEACCVFTDGVTNKGNWSCWTHHCEEEYINNLFGFVRGCLSSKAGRNVSMNETDIFLTDFLQKDFDESSYKIKREHNTQPQINRAEIRNRIKIPSEYYIRRGFLSETLDMFDVGECLVENQPMSGRVVVPIYDEDYNYVGCVGRAIKEHLKPKWLHSKGFSKNILYGMNLAKDYIFLNKTAILVEGQGDVWRMHEAGLKMTVGIFGASINEDQLILLEQSGALNIVVLTDSDEAGNKAYEQIVKKCGRRFNYFRPTITSKDVGDMSIEQIKKEVYPQLKGMINEN